MVNYLTVRQKEKPLMNHIYPKEYWDEAAMTDPYSAILSKFNEKKFWDMKVKINRLNKDTILLDLGCGIGRVAKCVSLFVKEYHGVDFSPKMINKAKKIFEDNKNVFFYTNNGIDLRGFEDDKFDMVYVELVFQHMQKEITFNYFREVYRVLKKGGVFLANNIPRIERYIGGLTKKELEDAIKPFKILNKKEDEFYYKCELEK